MRGAGREYHVLRAQRTRDFVDLLVLVLEQPRPLRAHRAAFNRSCYLAASLLCCASALS